MSSSPKLEKQAKVSKVGKLNSSHAKVPSAGATHSNAVTAGYRIISEGAAARCAMCVWQDITHVNCRNRRCEVDFSPPKWPTDMLEPGGILTGTQRPRDINRQFSRWT